MNDDATPPRLSPAEWRTLAAFADDEAYPPTDWLACYQLTRLGLLEDRPPGARITEAGKEALRLQQHGQ